MAYWLSLLCLAIWTTLPVIAAAQTANIPAEIINYVPPCAQKCFDSFVSANFDSDICGDSPSLQCLCRQRGNSGYTIGEGAVSCLVGESRFGACQGQDGIREATVTAYNMCVGVSKAAPKTHSTIMATLILPSSGTGPLLVPTAIQTATATGSVKDTTTSLPTPTVSLPGGDESTSITATSSSLSTSTTSTDTWAPTQTTSPSSESGDDQPQLSSGQIAGIAVGCTAVVVFGILLVLLARCIRRKRFGDVESGFFKIRESRSFGRKSRHEGSRDTLQISSPLPRVRVQRNPEDPRWQPGTPQKGVGLAISPLAARGGAFARPSPALVSALSASRAPTPPRKPSPVSVPNQAAPLRSIPKVVLSSAPPETRAPAAERSPPKPTLTLAIPNGQDRLARAPATSRDSVVTEFAEDGEGDVTAGPAIWRPPTSDPLSATTFYLADKGGNWILRSSSTGNPVVGTSRVAAGPAKQVVKEVPAAPVQVELPSPDHKTKAERARDAYGGFSPDAVVSPLRLPRRPGIERLGSPIAFRDQRREPQVSSPSASARLSVTAETITSESSQARNLPTDTYFTMMRESRDLTGAKSKRRPVPKVSRRESQDSATSIESAAEDEDVIQDEPQVDLSPVIESPKSPVCPGKSPVKYPGFRKQRDKQQEALPTKTAPPELLSPAYQYNVWHPPGYISPTGAGSLPKPRPAIPAASRSRNETQTAWNAPQLRPAVNRNPVRLQTGSPEARQGPPPPAAVEAQYWQRQRQIANPAWYWNEQPQVQTQTARPRPSQQRQQYNQQQQPPLLTPPYELPGEYTPPSSSRRYGTPKQPQPPYQQRRPGLPTPAATPQSIAAAGAIVEDASSPMTNRKQNQNQSQVQGQGQASLLLAKRRGAEKAAALILPDPSGKGRKGGGTDANGRRNKGGWAKEETEPGPVPPITPGWVPELTPTRKGEDLYLNVR
ncbi:hypothetical protein P885DRAFT_37696 [Corynascus similis CBS 632.67]